MVRHGAQWQTFSNLLVEGQWVTVYTLSGAQFYMKVASYDGEWVTLYREPIQGLDEGCTVVVPFCQIAAVLVKGDGGGP